MWVVDLGGGTNPHPRATHVIDLAHPRASPPQDATDTPWRIPDGDGHFGDGIVSEVVCSHFMEHVPKGAPLIRLVNEVWRVLEPGGTFTAVLPLVGWTDTAGAGHLVAGWQPYGDPTHVAHWWLPEGALYLCDGPYRPHADYGLASFAPLGPYLEPAEAAVELRHQALEGGHRTHPTFWSVRDGWEGVFRLVKP
jgi:hypothetical protein